MDSIRDDVYRLLHEYLSRDQPFVRKLPPVARMLAKSALRRSAGSVYAGLDYILSYAEKPEKSG